MTGKEFNGFARRHRQKHGFRARKRFIGVNHIRQDLWFDGKQHDLRAKVLGHVFDISDAIDAIAGLEFLGRFGLLNNIDIAGNKPLRKPAFEHGTAHLSTTDQQKTRIHKIAPLYPSDTVVRGALNSRDPMP